jgi:hypothetical protein
VNLVIEIIGDDGDLMPDADAEKAIRMLLADVTEETYGCLELTDLDGRALLARVSGKAIRASSVPMPGALCLAVIEPLETA